MHSAQSLFGAPAGVIPEVVCLHGLVARAIIKEVKRASGTTWFSGQFHIQRQRTKIDKLVGNPHEFSMAIAQSGFQELVITSRHAAFVHDLPLHHRDPFDRILLAQAIFEPMRLLTADRLLGKYSDLMITVAK